ncbi:MAG: TraR/DksA C4-type zinc finger protein [Candidatus Omnitrophica bacterium]|nr:TraR/DksA C4-type zinc finger protein [Candidatus Omnitrophota bacterium]
MPKKAKFSKKDLKIYKNLLLKKKLSILDGLDNITKEALKKSQREASGDLSGYTYHMADMASDVYDRDLLLQLASGEREILFAVDEAIKRIEEGEYGYCLNCKKKIANARLKAIPHTPYCRDCQEKAEKKTT